MSEIDFNLIEECVEPDFYVYLNQENGLWHIEYELINRGCSDAQAIIETTGRTLAMAFKQMEAFLLNQIANKG